MAGTLLEAAYSIVEKFNLSQELPASAICTRILNWEMTAQGKNLYVHKEMHVVAVVMMESVMEIFADSTIANEVKADMEAVLNGQNY